MKSSQVELIKSLVKGQSFKINGVEYVFIKNVDADSIMAGNRESGKQEVINLTFLTNKNSKTMTNTNEVSVEELVSSMNVKDLRTEARKFKIVGYSKMAKVVLQEKVIGEIEAAKPKTEAERFEDVIVKLARQKVDATIAKDQATDQDSKNFQSELIKDLNVALKEAKAKLNILLNPVVEVTKKEKAAAKNKPSKAQIAKDKKAAKGSNVNPKFEIKDKKDSSKTKEEKAKAKADVKKAKGLIMTEEVDKLISKGGTWKSLCKKAQEIGDARGQKTKYGKGTFLAQIKYRINQNSDYLKSLNMKVADEGIVKIK